MGIILIIIGILTVLVGIIGIIIPIIPAGAVVALGAVLIAWGNDFESVGMVSLVIIGTIGILSMILDQVASLYGAKQLGSSRAGLMGAFLGGIVGIFFAPFGIILGPLIGAFSFELFIGNTLKTAFKSGGGTLLGQLYAIIGKAILIAIQIAILVGAFTIYR